MYIKKEYKDNQITIKKKVSLSGTDPLNGNKVTLIFHPAPIDTGIVFKIGKENIPANIQYEKDIPMHLTVLSKNGADIKVTEHLLSAIYGLGINNIIIEVQNGNVIPIMDGSAQCFTETLLDSGIEIQDKPQTYFRVEKPFSLQYEESMAICRPAKNNLRVTAIIDFRDSAIDTQEFTFTLDSKKYISDIAPARTFFHKPYTPDRYQKIRETYKGLPTDSSKSPVITWNQDAYLQALRFKNEAIRHKILDFIGDMALIGYPLVGEFTLYKPSHKFNRLLARKIQELSENKAKM